MAKNSQNWFIRTVTIIIQILKVCLYQSLLYVGIYNVELQVPTVLAFVVALRQRGSQFTGLPFRSNDLQGATGT